MNINEILEEAIKGEVESYELYTWATDLVRTEHVKDTLRTLAQEELGHKALLEGMKASTATLRWQTNKLLRVPIQDYRIGDHLVVSRWVPIRPSRMCSSLPRARNRGSYQLYRDLAEKAEGQAHDVLEAMSKDELRHKNLVEGWYEEVVYQDF